MGETYGYDWSVKSMSLPKRCDWIKNPDIRPYVFLRKDNRVKEPGSFLKNCDWFSHLDVLKRDPLSMTEEHFGKLILELDRLAFKKSDMPMPGWVFYDCGLIPGVVSGFAYRTEKLPESLKKVFSPELLKTDWTPISLFIAIPCVNRNEWVAHNLTSINSLVEKKEDKLYGLGFLSKAFGLWYENIEKLCGMTQWVSPALKLHANYGDFEVLTAYTPVHSHAETMTYRCSLSFEAWQRFFLKTKNPNFLKENEAIKDFTLDVKNTESLKTLQKRIESTDVKYFLKPDQVRQGVEDEPLSIYQRL